MSNRNPGIVLDEIQESRERLSALGGEYAEKRDALAAAEVDYQKELGKTFIGLLDSAKRAGERVPAEDMRKQIAHEKMDERIWASYIQLTAEAESLDKLLKIELARLSSLQSELKWLEGEYRATRSTEERTPLGPLGS